MAARRRRSAWVGVGVGIATSLGATVARAESCSGLWYSRNEIYKAQGYCFHTPRAIRAFGNAGCQYDDVEAVPLSGRQHQVIADIVEQERVQGCRD